MVPFPIPSLFNCFKVVASLTERAYADGRNIAITLHHFCPVGRPDANRSAVPLAVLPLEACWI
jgi:hypothetical protein